MEGGSPESYEKVRMDEHEDKGESPVKTTPIKTERMKSNNNMEMLKFFDLLPEGAQEKILKNLCRNAAEFTNDEDEEEESPVNTNRQSKTTSQQWKANQMERKPVFMMNTLKRNARRHIPRNMKEKFPLINLHQGFRLPLPLIAIETLAK